MMDMDDALAMGSLKTTMLSDQTTQGMLALADHSSSRARAAAPGSGADAYGASAGRGP